jgi:predicted transcriptional regulator
MKQDLKVNELMIPIAEYPRIFEADTLQSAIKKLIGYFDKGYNYRSLLVFSENNILVGILTIRDILNEIKKNTMPYDIDKFYPVSWKMFLNEHSLKESILASVKDVLRPLVNVRIQSGREVTTAIQQMLFITNINILPVYEGEKPVGVVRAVDVFKFIGNNI